MKAGVLRAARPGDASRIRVLLEPRAWAERTNPGASRDQDRARHRLNVVPGVAVTVTVMAQFEDAAIGWGIFRGRRGSVSRSQLNQALRARGRKPISDRTYSHYQKLMRLGYTEYVSINRLDVRHANESIFDVSDRSRYLELSISDPGRLVVPRGQLMVELSGTIERVSEGFALLRVRRTAQAVEIAKATKYNKGVLVFEQVGVERAVRVVEGVSRGRAFSLLLEFRSLLETDLIVDESPFPQHSSRLEVDLGPDASLYRIIQTVHTTFDLLESMRGFVQVAAASAADSFPPTPTFRVRRLEFSNPLEAIIVGAVVVIGGVAYILDRVSRSVGSAADAVSKVDAVGRDRRAEQRAAELHDAQLKSLQLDNIKKALEVRELLEEVGPGLSEVMGVEIPALSDASEARLEALKDQAVEAAAELSTTTAEPIVLEQDVD